MALKPVLPNLDGLNPAIAAEYSKGEDGQFYLQAEGMILKSKFEGKLQESNNKNSSLSQQIQELRALAEGRVEKAEVEKLQAELNDIKSGKGGESFEKILEAKIANFKATAESQISKLKEDHAKAAQEAASARAQLKTFRINQEVQAAASAVGLRAKNAPQYLALAASDFDFDESLNRVVAVKRSKGPDGKEVVTPIQGQDWEPVKLSDFIAENHRKEAFDVFFDTGSGTGAPGQTKPAGTSGGVYITREQAKDPRAYAAAKEANKGAIPQVEPSRT